jgi:RND family efflux transporter MFP subunit
MKNLLYISLITMAWACGPKKQEKPKIILEEILPVQIAKIETKILSDEINSSGVLSSKSEIKLAFKTGGLIKKIYVQEGQYVKAGQILAELDLSEINASVGQAQIGLAKAQRDFDRAQKMYAEEAATKANVQDAQSGLEIAQQSIKAASFNRKLSKIIAPSNGVILKKIAEQGELITPFMPAFVLGSGAGTYVVNLGLTDKQIVKINKGDLAEIKLDAYPDEVFKATVSQISQTINPSTGTFEVELALAPTAKKLMSGFMASGIIKGKIGVKSLVVPVSALTEAEMGAAFVYVYDAQSQIAAKREIKIGKVFNSDVVLISGLKEGDMVITQGSGFVTDNQKVKVNR